MVADLEILKRGISTVVAAGIAVENSLRVAEEEVLDVGYARGGETGD